MPTRLFLLCVLVLGACGDDGGDDPAAPAPTTQDAIDMLDALARCTPCRISTICKCN